MNPIETQHLSRRFGGTEAVHAIDLVVPAGSVCALLGPNGAGKTTTIKLLLNLLRPTSGVSRVLGVPSSQLSPRELAQVGYVSENQDLPRWMTVAQLLDYCRPLYPTWDRALERQLLARFDLPTNQTLKHISRGMAMKAALLVSLAYRPRLVILDEPFSGLDPLVRDDFIAGLLETAETGDWTMLVSSHDIDEIERLADRVALLDRGRLRLQESTATLQSRFRRIDVALAGDHAETGSPPAHWLELERAGERLRFVDSAYSPEATESACRERFPNAIVEARPMTLREIFVVLARTGRHSAKGLAA